MLPGTPESEEYQHCELPNADIPGGARLITGKDALGCLLMLDSNTEDELECRVGLLGYSFPSYGILRDKDTNGLSRHLI